MAVGVPILVMLGNGAFPLTAFTIGVVALALMAMISRGLPRFSAAVPVPIATPTPTLVPPQQNAA